MAVAASQLLLGPGRFSTDRALGIRVPWTVAVVAATATAVGIGLGIASRPAPRPELKQRAGGALGAGREEAPTAAGTS